MGEMAFIASVERQVLAGATAAASQPGSSRAGCLAIVPVCSLRRQQSVFRAAVGKGALKAARRGQTCRSQAAQAVLEETTLPATYVRYETMIVLRPDLTNEARDVQLAKFETFLNSEECLEISALVRGRQPLAYPIKGNWEGIYVLYAYAAKPSVSQAVQTLLSTPEAGGENTILRHMTFRQ